MMFPPQRTINNGMIGTLTVIFGTAGRVGSCRSTVPSVEYYNPPVSVSLSTT